MKILAIALCIGAFILVIIAIFLWYSEREAKSILTIIHTLPPPGYEIVCDVGRGIYGVKMPGGDYVISKDPYERYFKSKQDAIKRAWQQYEYISQPEPPKEVYNWVKCE